MTRAELYDLVWGAPLVQVANQFGISTAALRKLCNDYAVPLPPSGYWTKVAYGKPAGREPLPDRAPRILERFNARLRRFGRAVVNAADVQIEAYTLQPSHHEGAAAEPVPAIEGLDAALSAAPVSSEGTASVDWSSGIQVRVAPASIPRAVAFLSALLTAAKTTGFTISEENGLLLDTEIFAVRLYETRDKQTGRSRPRPSGRLCFEIFDPRLFQWADDNLVARWYDAKGSRIEDKIRVALADTVNAASLIRSARKVYESELDRKISAAE